MVVLFTNLSKSKFSVHWSTAVQKPLVFMQAGFKIAHLNSLSQALHLLLQLRHSLFMASIPPATGTQVMVLASNIFIQHGVSHTKHVAKFDQTMNKVSPHKVLAYHCSKFNVVVNQVPFLIGCFFPSGTSIAKSVGLNICLYVLWLTVASFALW